MTSRGDFDIQAPALARRQAPDNNVHAVPADIDREVACLKPAAMDIRIDSLTAEQLRYLSSSQEGT